MHVKNNPHDGKMVQKSSYKINKTTICYDKEYPRFIASVSTPSVRLGPSVFLSIDLSFFGLAKTVFDWRSYKIFV